MATEIRHVHAEQEILIFFAQRKMFFAKDKPRTAQHKPFFTQGKCFFAEDKPRTAQHKLPRPQLLPPLQNDALILLKVNVSVAA